MLHCVDQEPLMSSLCAPLCVDHQLLILHFVLNCVWINNNTYASIFIVYRETHNLSTVCRAASVNFSTVWISNPLSIYCVEQPILITPPSTLNEAPIIFPLFTL